MGRIPKHFISDLIDKADIVEVIEKRMPLKKAGKNYQACCPFHNEKTPSFSVSPDKQFYYCFGCGATGNVISFIMEYDRLGFVEAVEDLAHSLALEVPREQQNDNEASDKAYLYQIMEKATQFFQKQLKQQDHKAVTYLKQRGISGEVARDFRMGYALNEWQQLENELGKSQQQYLVRCGMMIEKPPKCYDRFRDRIMFPIRDRRGRVIAFGGRVIDQGEPKYLNSPETEIFHKNQSLYGLYEALQAQKKIEWFLIVEGYMDVVALAEFGIKNAVATLGTATSDHHIQQLFRISPTLVFCFDGDRAGRDAALRALNHSLAFIRDNREIRFMFLPESDDPDSYVRQHGAQAFLDATQSAQTLFEFLLNHLKSQVDLSRFEGPGKLANLAKPFINQINDDIHRERFITQLANDVNIGKDKLMQLLASPQSPKQETKAKQTSLRTPPGQPSLIRQAITLLLHAPATAQNISNIEWIQSLKRPGSQLLFQILEQLQQQPNLSTGALIEYWRDSEHYRHLLTLASEKVITPIEGISAELTDILSSLRRSDLELRRDELLNHSKEHHLSQSEKDELRKLTEYLK